MIGKQQALPEVNKVHLRQLNRSILHFCRELAIFGLTSFNFKAMFETLHMPQTNQNDFRGERTRTW